MPTDPLLDMFSRQRALQALIGPDKAIDLERPTPERVISDIRTQVLSLEDELHEALAETGWKPWATTRHINSDALKNELVDAWHFFMNLCILADMDPAELYERYVRKNNKNVQRHIEGKYSGRDKCPVCKRAYDDEAVLCLANPAPAVLAWCVAEGRHATQMEMSAAMYGVTLHDAAA